MGKPKSMSEPNSKSDCKFKKKLQFYSKVRDTVAALSAKKEISKKKKLRRRQKKLKAYDLSSLSEFLPELKSLPQPSRPEPKLTCKSMPNLILKEGKQLTTVLNHPAFRSDPVGAIHQHLLSTQPAVHDKPKERRNVKERKKLKKKKSSSTSRPESMDI